MSSIQGYPSQEKLVNPLVGYDQQNSKTSSQFVTLSETFDKKVTLDAKIHGEFRTSALPKLIASVATDYPKQVIKSTGHGAVKGDAIRFEGTAANPYFSAKVINVPDANTLIIGSTLPVAPLVSDEFFVLKSIVPLYDEDGALQVSQGPIQFIRDGAATQVVEDTVTPANNIPLPVKLTSVTGDINITAGDLNVQLSDTGANPDITRIGDGTNRLVMTALGEATTFDATTHGKLDTQTALLQTIDTDTGLIQGSVDSIDTKTSTVITELQSVNSELDTQTIGISSINSELDAQTTLLNSIANEDFATQTTLSAVNGKLPATLGQKVAADSLAVVLASDQALPLPSGAATEATLDAIKTSTELLDDTVATDGGAALTKLQTIGGHTGTTSHAWHVNNQGEGKVTSDQLPAALGQTTMANSTSVALASDQSPLNVRSGLVPREYDQIDLTYVPSGNGVGEVQTAVYKLATVTQATLTLTYDSSNRLSSVVRT